MQKRIYVVGTADTKGDELAFLADAVAAAGARSLCVSTSARARRPIPVDIAAAEVAAHHPRALAPCSAATIAARRWQR